MQKIDWITISIWAIMLICIVVAVQVFYNAEIRECISEPLSYGARQLEDQYGFPFQGSGVFIMEHGDSPITIMFSGDGVTSKSNAYNPMYSNSPLTIKTHES